MIILLIILGAITFFQYFLLSLSLILDASDEALFKIIPTKKQLLFWLIPCYCIYYLFTHIIKAWIKAIKELK